MIKKLKIILNSVKCEKFPKYTFAEALGVPPRYLGYCDDGNTSMSDTSV